MIHFVVGTKAQLVKIAPIMMEMQKRGIFFNFIFTGQHQETMDVLRENFSVKPPDITLHRGKDITSIPAMLLWLIKILYHTFTHRKAIFKGDRKGIVLVHGDTFSTLLGAIMGRLAGLKVGHVESGLRSFNLFHPFPEEITRILTFYLTDIYFAPGDWAVRNLKEFKGEKVNTQYNTLLDALRTAIQRFDSYDIAIPTEKYAVVTTHRFENIFRKEVFEHNLELIETITAQMKTIFILHPITEKKLREYNLFERLANNPRIEMRPRYDYFRFIKLVSHSEFLVTDGGSNQEECCYMGKPCLLLRKATEREDGLGKNVVLSNYKKEVFLQFLDNYPNHIGGLLEDPVSPVGTIIDHVLSFA